MLYRIQHRRGTAAQWTAENPILAGAEFGFETDTGKFKIGNGITAWSGLKYFQNFDDIKSAIVDSAPSALDTLNELAAALNDDANYAATITGLLANKAPLNSPVFSGTVDFSNSLVTGVMLPINWTGEYSNSGEYLENDMVEYQGSTYYATGPNLNFVDGYYPTALNADWELFAAKGEKGDQGEQGPEGPPVDQLVIDSKANLSGATFTGAISAPSLSLTNALPVSSGGTGSSTASSAKANLEIFKNASSYFGGKIFVQNTEPTTGMSEGDLWFW